MTETVSIKTDSAITYEVHKIIQCGKCGSYILLDREEFCPSCGDKLEISKSKLVFRRFRG